MAQGATTKLHMARVPSVKRANGALKMKIIIKNSVGQSAAS